VVAATTVGVLVGARRIADESRSAAQSQRTQKGGTQNTGDEQTKTLRFSTHFTCDLGETICNYLPEPRNNERGGKPYFGGQVRQLRNNIMIYDPNYFLLHPFLEIMRFITKTQTNQSIDMKLQPAATPPDE
jgi:hypothetical protein